MMKVLFFCCMVTFCTSCNLKEQEKTPAKIYFDSETYFKKEAQRLTQKNRMIDKTVIVNGSAEHKKLAINNWEKEFSIFIDADINKASWRGSFKYLGTADFKTYTSQSDKIPIKKLEVTYKNNKVSAVKVYITTTNDLYTSKDSLSYYPDSLYQIKKVQQIRLLNERKYQVTGRF